MNVPAKLSTFLTRAWQRDGALALLRVWLGVVMIIHGNSKFFGDKSGMTENLSNLGFPAPEVFAWLAAFGEFGGGVLLVIGLLTRPAAILVGITMSVAAFVAHGGDPFAKKELALAYLVMAIVVAIAGPGKMSIDNGLFGRRKGG